MENEINNFQKIFLTAIFLFFGIFGMAEITLAANIYVDQTLSANCTSNNYSAVNRACSGVDGDAYMTIQAGVDAMSSGDVLYMRGGIYDISATTGEGEISIAGKDGTSWDEGAYFKMTSYLGEWAILDGKRDTVNGVVLHGGFPCYGADVNSHYWWFEKFEVMGGGRESGDTTASGIWVNVGPFKFRYLYVHNNLSYVTLDNPGGISMTEAVNSVIEYCVFKDNGSTSTTNSHNGSNIIFYGEVGDLTATGENGYSTSRGGSINNVVRYSYFYNTTGQYGVGIKNKVAVFFSGRNPDGGHGWEDVYNNYGLKIHHNIFYNLSKTAIMIDSDFPQVYHNIIDSCGSPNISIAYSPGINAFQFYKGVTYNNTMRHVQTSAINRYGRDNEGESYFPTWQPDRTHYGWDYNNIIEDGVGTSPWGEEEIINVTPYASGVLPFDLTNYIGSNNFFFSPNSSDVYRLNALSYTPVEYEAQSETGSPKVVYSSNTGNPFLGESGADAYRTDGSYIIEDSTTIANGGIGGNHPYLSEVTIPSYIGATDPNDDDWVEGVLALDSTYMTTASGDPDWIEGVATDPTPPSAPSGLSVS